MGYSLGEVLVQMLPMILGAALLPLWIIIVLMLLSSENGLAKGAAFVAGATVARLVQGVFLGWVFSSGSATESETAIGGALSMLLVILGLFMFVTAWRHWREEPDPDAPPPRLLTTIAALSPLKAFGAGALLVTVAVKLWVFTLGAVSIIDAADLSRSQSIAAYLLYVILAESLVILPVVAYAVAPAQAASSLGAMRAWLERNFRVIMIVVSLVFGTFFLWKGLSGMMA